MVNYYEDAIAGQSIKKPQGQRAEKQRSRDEQWGSRNQKKQVEIHNVVNYYEDVIAGQTINKEASGQSREVMSN